mgnify:CR=1 FL=1
MTNPSRSSWTDTGRGTTIVWGESTTPSRQNLRNAPWLARQRRVLLDHLQQLVIGDVGVGLADGLLD